MAPTAVTEALTLEQLLAVPQVWSFDALPDGRLVFAWNPNGRWELFRLDPKVTAGVSPVPLLRDWPESALDPMWSPDGTRIVFVSDHDGDENFNLYVMSAAGGTPQPLTTGKRDHRLAAWAPDGHSLAFVSNRHGGHLQLFTVSADGGEPQQRTHHDDPVGAFVWSPDGRSIAYTIKFRESEVWLLDVPAAETRRVLARAETEVTVGNLFGVSGSDIWAPDGSGFLFTSNEHDVAEIGFYRVSGGEVSWLHFSARENISPVFSPDGKRIAFLEHESIGWSAQVKDARLDAAPQRVSPATGVASATQWAGDALLFLHTDARTPIGIWRWAGDAASPVVQSLPDGFPSAHLVAPEPIQYLSTDGLSIPALLYQGAGHAALICPHGGPESHRSDIWDPFVQFLVLAGYSVLLPNFRGSTGYGRKFRTMADRDLGGADLEDVASGADFLVSEGIADAGRVGIYGASYGGYMTLMCITKKPEKWAAATSLVGIYNWQTMWETSREFIVYYFKHKFGTPDEVPELYYDRSPIHFADCIRCPLLLIQTEQDPRCPISEARHLAAALDRNKIPYELHTYPDEGHGFRKLTNRIDAYTRMRNFFRQHLPPA